VTTKIIGYLQCRCKAVLRSQKRRARRTEYERLQRRLDGRSPLALEALVTDGAWGRVGLSWDGAERTLYVDEVRVAKDDQPSFMSSEDGLRIGIGEDVALGTY
jgi:hypothetical protein